MTTEAKNDDQFYFAGQYIVLQAGKTRFRVPSETLTRESKFFADLLSLPVPASSETVEGASDDKPIMLPESISAKSFRSLLKILYSFVTLKNFKLGGSITLEKSEWISVLELATMWYFLECRKMAIFELNHLLSPLEKVYHGRKQKVTLWLQQGYKALVERDATITDDEALTLTTNSGPEYSLSAVALMRIREKKVKASGGKARLASDFAEKEIQQEFEQELHTVREMEGAYGNVVGQADIDMHDPWKRYTF